MKELREKGFSVDQQINTKINYEKIEIDTRLKVDLLVNEYLSNFRNNRLG
ncbi:GxxExxY protein [Chryseobacterium fluminis]